VVKNSLFLAGLVLGISFFITPTAQAVAAQPKGISLSPFQQQVSMAPGDVSKSFVLRLTNHTKTVQELRLSPRDFGSLNDSGGVLLDASKSYTQKYGLASWLTLETDTVVLNPGESREVLVTIDNRTSLRPGGHYGAVATTVTSLIDKADNEVAVNQQLLSLIFVTKLGGAKYDLKLSSMSHNGNWLHLPKTVQLRFQNPGNVHVIPRGEVKLRSPDGTIIARGVINSESAFVLPESFRELYVPLTTVGRAAPLPGLYSVSVEYRYDGLNRTAQKDFKLQFISLGLYVVIIVLLSGAAWFYWHKTRAKKT
jgi:hypothetical protein